MRSEPFQKAGTGKAHLLLRKRMELGTKLSSQHRRKAGTALPLTNTNFKTQNNTLAGRIHSTLETMYFDGI